MQQSATIQETKDEKKDLLLLYQMMLIRRFEEKAAEQYTKAKIRGFLHLYIGEEAVADMPPPLLVTTSPMANNAP